MASIRIYDLPISQEIEFIKDLNNTELLSLFGGEDNDVNRMFYYGVKGLEFMLAIFAMDSILFLTNKMRNFLLSLK
ncbi:hypothetical protein PN480_17990 [Dolichospermum circinale CS-1225]|uniref:Uncharacterized protein n=1 Tax=Dolichospermum circinale CS-537/01 TaxID=3021739 RepID=A0ABT5A9R0_9CYAN|nr:hypothetical protein [Dolichospermum circinale]MDB9466361.1 hypothetical protein [Dolichospermum circinale CS-539/09]MDB9470067.1 hypothetical protein [Dolichospermum circinale CS-539]MDB9488669.1 hypothetical protein [Dolichospermum circinale CS-537/01]MDB9523821.1 hypothetical protein [Dolichospermum circinale CS-1225]